MTGTDDLGDIRAVCPGASLKSESGQRFVDLPALKITVGHAIIVRDALLTLQAHSGYDSRLFVSQPIPGRGINWTTHVVLGRTWHTPSWRGVPPSHAAEMLLLHVKVYR